MAEKVPFLADPKPGLLAPLRGNLLAARAQRAAGPGTAGIAGTAGEKRPGGRGVAGKPLRSDERRAGSRLAPRRR